MYEVGDKVKYVGLEEPISGVIETLLKKPDGQLAGYKVRLEDGRALMCSTDDDEVVREEVK